MLYPMTVMDVITRLLCCHIIYNESSIYIVGYDDSGRAFLKFGRWYDDTILDFHNRLISSFEFVTSSRYVYIVLADV